LSLFGIYLTVASSGEACEGGEGLDGKLLNTGAIVGWLDIFGGIKADDGETGMLIDSNVGLFVGAADGINLQPTPSNGVQLSCALIGSARDPVVKRKLSAHFSPVGILLF
jgi:hypothetical protein